MKGELLAIAYDASGKKMDQHLGQAPTNTGRIAIHHHQKKDEEGLRSSPLIEIVCYNGIVRYKRCLQGRTNGRAEEEKDQKNRRNAQENTADG